MSERSEDCILILGLGDLGQRVINGLSQRHAARLVAAARDREVAEAVAGQARLIAGLCDGPRRVEASRIDLDDLDQTAAELDRLRPDVIVLTASRVTWWQLPDQVARVPYGAWVPLQVTLVRRLMEARAAAGLAAPVVALPYPDAVGPILASVGLAPELGAGNVLEIAAKLTALAAERHNVPRENVQVRLVAHHATERAAFSAFQTLAGAGPLTPAPFIARIFIGGQPLPDETIRAYFNAPYALPPGRAAHNLTTAATIATIDALRSNTPRNLHVPAPGGRPGGYPVAVSRAGVELDLPDDVTEADAIAVNAVAARWDGIEQIAPNGTMKFTPTASDEIERALGLRVEQIAIEQHPAIADQLAARLRDLSPAT
ncbi:MAG: hypothetical protein M3Y09_00100 [Actinomycetota bacterium]|nr:hypothetical protein [Actinomycetota bacterium]